MSCSRHPRARLVSRAPIAKSGRTVGGLGWIGLSVVLSFGCSSRVPYRPDPVVNSDKGEDVGVVFEPDVDASLNGDDVSDAAERANETPHDLSSEAGTIESTGAFADGANGTSLPGTTSNASATSETPPGDVASTAGPGPESITPAPVPTQQLSIPLPNASVKFAIVVSVDGLAPRFLEQLMAMGGAPTFTKLQGLAAWTHDARTDKTHTYTLPNHTCMLTGLPVEPVPGLESYRAHFYIDNSDPAPGETLHQLRLPEHSYTPSMFDVAHDHGLVTAMYASKTKFSLYSQTYNDAGGLDAFAPDNGTHKIDHVVLNTDPAFMVADLVTELRTLPPHLTFVHLNQPDLTGHSLGWGSPEYLHAVSAMDALLGQILATIQQGQLENRTALIVTSDHGGVDFSHLDAENPFNYRIPFYVLAPGLAPGDIYASLEHRVAPDGADNPGYEELGQPIRNGDAGNLALDLLGLEPIPDSVIKEAGLIIAP